MGILSRVKRYLRLKFLLSGVNTVNPGPICGACVSNVRKNQQTIKCTKCTVSHHRTCLGYTNEDFKELIREPWTCTKCIENRDPKCVLCMKNKRSIIVRCTQCEQSYHSSCFKKQFPGYIPDDFVWVCPPCSEKNGSPNDSETISVNPKINRAGLLLGHINIQNITTSHKKHEIEEILRRENFHVLGISETWLDSEISDNEWCIPGYNLVRVDRVNKNVNKKYSGVLILYISKNVHFTTTLSMQINLLEAIQVRINIPHIKPIFISLIYRHTTTNNKEFLKP